MKPEELSYINILCFSTTRIYFFSEASNKRSKREHAFMVGCTYGIHPSFDCVCVKQDGRESATTVTTTVTHHHTPHLVTTDK